MSTKAVANFIAETSFKKLPPEVVVQAKKAIRDVIGVSIAAHKDRAVQASRRMAIARGGKKESTLIGMGMKVPCEMAAFVNTVMASTLDMDDGSMGLPGHPRVHRGHPGAIVIPSSLAVAEREGATGRELIEAVVVGYEVALATAWMIGVTVLAGRTGTYGAAASAAKLLGLSRNEIISALNIAEAHCPSPTYAFIWDQTDMTKEAPAWAAMTGVTASLLSQAGYRGAPTIYDLQESDKKPIVALGNEWEILGLYFKLYSACRLAHASIDGVLEITKEHGLNAQSISAITIGCSTQKGLKMSNSRPANIWQAQYSIPFIIGAALVDGEVGPGQIAEDRLGDKLILHEAEKVRMVADSEVDALLPDMFAGRVEVNTKDGRKFQTFKRYPKGEPENPLTEEELSDKFKKLVTEVVGVKRAEELAMLIDRLEKLDNIEGLIEKISYL
ncbi:MAG: MmgE/PrpD family protein [Deltaproteobacteria bacterium]|nr:MmgE/PrpD family protein [Deltaproteobacteria bacterium]